MTKTKTDKKSISATTAIPASPKTSKEANSPNPSSALNTPVTKIKTRTKDKDKNNDKDKEESKSNEAVPSYRFDINQLNLTQLQRYRRVNKLTTVKIRSSREELAKAAVDHYNSMNVNEAEMLASFIYFVAKKKTKLNHLAAE